MVIYLNIKVEPDQCRSRGLRLVGKDVTAFKIGYRRRRKRTQTYALRQFHRVPLLQLTDDRRARRGYSSLCSDTYHEHRIACVHLAPLQTYGEHAGITAMISCEIPQQLGCSFGQGPRLLSTSGAKSNISTHNQKHSHNTYENRFRNVL